MLIPPDHTENRGWLSGIFPDWAPHNRFHAAFWACRHAPPARAAYPRPLRRPGPAGQPVYLTKNGYGTMVVMSIEEYSRLTDPVEMALDLADRQAASSSKRLSAEEVFSAARKAVNE